jgi:hypothetical protein
MFGSTNAYCLDPAWFVSFMISAVLLGIEVFGYSRHPHPFPLPIPCTNPFPPFPLKLTTSMLLPLPLAREL